MLSGRKLTCWLCGITGHLSVVLPVKKQDSSHLNKSTGGKADVSSPAVGNPEEQRTIQITCSPQLPSTRKYSRQGRGMERQQNTKKRHVITEDFGGPQA